MSKSEKYISVQLVPKESVTYYGDDFVQYIVDNLKRTMSEKVLDRATLSDVIVSLKPTKITEQPSWNQVEYRLNMTVTDLVRCEDCKYKQGNACDYSAVWVRPNGFCHWGERREDESD